MTLPRPLRNHLAELVLEAFHDVGSRRALARLAGSGANVETAGASVLSRAFPATLFETSADGPTLRREWRACAPEFGERAARASRALAGHPVDPPRVALETALGQAALLFDARLFFEAHERLEPYWIQALGPERERLQGLIQVSVAFEHLASGNARGARALLRDGVAKLAAHACRDLELDQFLDALRGSLASIETAGDAATTSFDWDRVPPFRAPSSLLRHA